MGHDHGNQISCEEYSRGLCAMVEYSVWVKSQSLYANTIIANLLAQIHKLKCTLLYEYFLCKKAAILLSGFVSRHADTQLLTANVYKHK